MKPEKVFKRYDIRGRYPEEVNEEFSETLGKSFGQFILENNKTKVVVSRDNKTSSKKLKNNFIEGLRALGIDVLDAGVGPTDYTALTGTRYDCFSVQITSSHMPANFNGFKFMYPEGNGLLNPDLDKIKNNFRDGTFNTTEKGEIDLIHSKSLETYKEQVKDFVTSNFDVTESKVVIDTLGGATSSILKTILEDLGHEVIDIEEVKHYSDKPYRDPPNPKPCYLVELKEVVKEKDAEIGVATDMDGDRATAYFDNRFLDGDEVFAVFSELVEDNIVASIDTSKIVEESVEGNNKNIFYTRVGDPFVMDKALEENVALAGEPNGHYSFLDFVPYNSGTLSVAILASIDIEECLKNLRNKYRSKTSVSVENKEKTVKEIANVAENKHTIVSKLDGVKFETEEEVLVLVRSSGSSSKVRIIAEGREKENVDSTVENIVNQVK